MLVTPGPASSFKREGCERVLRGAKLLLRPGPQQVDRRRPAMTSMNNHAESTICVLAFGDSLTEGYYSYGTAFHPYAKKLDGILKSHNPMYKVSHSGVSGECVLDTMQQRLQDELRQAEAEGTRYRWVLILAGVNDVGTRSKAADIFQGLVNMYQACHAHGATVLAMTCLENFGTGVSGLDLSRQRLNDLIRSYCAEHPSQAVLLDLDKLLPYVSLNDEQRAELFDDGLHLTPQGYDRMAELIAPLLIASG